MTDKSRKIEDHSGGTSGKVSRGHASSHTHHSLTPTPSTGFYTIGAATDMSRHVPPPHHPLGPYLTPSYMPHPLTIQGGIPPGPGPMSNDLGPPIFMPSLNLGTPKQPIKGHKVSNVTSSHINISHDTVSSPSNEFSPPIISPYPSAGVVKATYSSVKIAQPNLINSSVKKGKIDGKSSLMPLPHTVAMRHSEQRNTPSPSYSTNSMGMNPAGSMGMNLVKPTYLNSLSPGSSEEGYTTTPTYPPYGGVVPMSGVPKQEMKSYGKSSDPSTADSSKTGGGVTVMTLASGMSGGHTLLCNERLSPSHTDTSSISLSTNTSTANVYSSNEQLRYDRVHTPTINHYPSSDTNVHPGNNTGDSIPWPEAMSKTIIIPAPNLTGKDIANLTSSASSSPLSNDKINNDGHWPTTPTDPPPFIDERNFIDGGIQPSMIEGGVSTNNNNHLIDANNSNTAAGSSTLFGSSHMVQGSSSPRPSILRKRPLDRSSDTLVSPSAMASHTHLTRPSTSSNKTSLICNEHSLIDGSMAHHMTGGVDMYSPRKRPRKQQFDSMNSNNTHISTPNNSLSHERLFGPSLSHKNKDRYSTTTITTGTSSSNSGSSGGNEGRTSSVKEMDKLYISQLRKSQYPIGYLSKKSHKSTLNHFKRHGDIKTHEELLLTLHDTCNAENTWLRSSGWKIHHLKTHLNEIEGLENNTLQMIIDLESVANKVLESLPAGTLTDGNHKFLDNLIQDTKERSRRSLLHIKETRDNMLKVLDSNGKVIEIMKKFSTSLPVAPSLTSTSVSSLPSED